MGSEATSDLTAAAIVGRGKARDERADSRENWEEHKKPREKNPEAEENGKERNKAAKREDGGEREPDSAVWN